MVFQHTYSEIKQKYFKVMGSISSQFQEDLLDSSSNNSYRASEENMFKNFLLGNIFRTIELLPPQSRDEKQMVIPDFDPNIRCTYHAMLGCREGMTSYISESSLPQSFIARSRGYHHVKMIWT